MDTQLPSPKKGAEPPIFGPSLLWPNGCMDQDATWYGGRPRPTQHCVRCGPSYPLKKGTPILPNFGPCLLWPPSPISATAELLLNIHIECEVLTENVEFPCDPCRALSIDRPCTRAFLVRSVRNQHLTKRVTDVLAIGTPGF